MTTQNSQIDFDQPLATGSAVAKDILSRKSFAEAAAGALQKVTSVNGFVLSVEGAWGSGKTSTLAMIEETVLIRLTPNQHARTLRVTKRHPLVACVGLNRISMKKPCDKRAKACDR